ncbi:MAG: TadE/TadG family type IV pilus assembly protein [Candidatus Cybelea sp.]
MSIRIWEHRHILPETVFSIAVALAVIFGIMDLGRAMYTYASVTELAREGSRWSIVRGSQSCVNSANQLDNCNVLRSAPVQSYVQSLSKGAMVASEISVTARWPSCTATGPAGAINAPGCTVAISVKYPFQFLLPFLPQATLSMSGTSTMVISQ